MRWLDKFKRQKEPEEKGRTRRREVSCEKCSRGIPCLETSIGEAIEDQGAFLYSGSEGRLYEPMYEGVVCLSCKLTLCEDCQASLINQARCPKCGGMLRQIIESRLPKED